MCAAEIGLVQNVALNNRANLTRLNVFFLKENYTNGWVSVCHEDMMRIMFSLRCRDQAELLKKLENQLIVVNQQIGQCTGTFVIAPQYRVNQLLTSTNNRFREAAATKLKYYK